MFPPSFATLPDNPFVRLRALLAGATPKLPLIDLSIGEPQHPVPDFVAPILTRENALFGKYPPTDGTQELRAAAAGWLGRRFGIPLGFVDADRHIVPVSGTREALFLAAQLAPEKRLGDRPLVLMPNPFYQTYAGAAVSIGAEPRFVPAPRMNNFLPDYESLPKDVLERTIALNICSPANPQGTVADLDYWRRLLALARRHGILVLSDECYTEIYDRAPPPSLLEAAAETGDLSNIIVFHSLSKRSNLPGLRSGFVVGPETLMAAFKKLRLYGGAPLPLPIQAVSAAAWSDDAHVEANRRAYREKIDAAAAIFGQRLGFYRPPGGFFLWLDVSESGLDSERATRRLFEEAGVRVLPGAYLSRHTESSDGTIQDPGADFLRLALVADVTSTTEALRRVNQFL